MNNLQQKALQLVEDLNEESFIERDMEYYSPFEFRSVGWQGSTILFMGVCVWSEHNEEREFNEEINDYEPLRDFVIRESFKILKDLQLRMKTFKTNEKQNNK